MKLYYTGAAKYPEPQSNPLLSLGGYLSNSPVPNGGLSNLFGAISQKDMRNGIKEMRAIVLKNEEATTQDVKLYYNNISKQPITSFKMALVSPALDTCNELYIEKIASGYNKPVNAIFNDNRGESNSLDFAIPAGDYVAIWIERSVNAAQASPLLSCDALFAAYESTDQVSIIDMTLNTNIVIGTYWTFDTPTSKMYVWYDDIASPSLISNEREGIRVPVNVGDSIEQIIAATNIAITSILQARGDVIIESSTNTLKITATTPGAVALALPQTSPVTFIQNQGSSSIAEIIEDVEIIIDYEVAP